jgi:branched-chain amino acid transport system substrate-binding protein
MRSVARTFMVALSLLLLLRPGSLGADAPPTPKGVVRIGLLDATSGPYAPIGNDVNSGFQYFLAAHGDQLGGFQVELRTGDEGGSPASALKVAHQLVEQDTVDVIVGVGNTDDAYAIADYLETQKKPLVVANAGADGLTQDRASKNLFRVVNTNSQATMALGDYACRKLQRHTAAILGSDDAYGWESSGGFARTYTASGCRITQEQYVADGTDWTAALDKLDRSANLVFLAVDGPDAPRVLAAYRNEHLSTQVLGDSRLTDEPFLTDERDRALGVITAGQYTSMVRSPDNEDFKKGYESIGGHAVSEYVESGYVAAQALNDALERLPPGAVKADALELQLRGVQLDAPRGPLRLDGMQQAVDDVYVRRVIQIGGRYRNAIVTTYPFITQFWHYDPDKYLHLPPYAKLKGTWARQ